MNSKLRSVSVMSDDMSDIKFEIKHHIGILSEGAEGSRKELNLVSWNRREPKYDLRDCSPEHEKMGKGLTLSNEPYCLLRTPRMAGTIKPGGVDNERKTI